MMSDVRPHGYVPAPVRGLYIAGMATVFWDRFLVLTISEFHLKASYFLLLLALAGYLASGGLLELSARLKTLLRPLVKSPWVWMLAFSLLCLVFCFHSPQVKKSIGYTMWCFFNLVAFAALGIALFASRGDAAESRWREWLVYGWAAGVVLVAAIAIIDYVAFFFGAKDGLIGGFQPIVFGWAPGGLPRPYAFSYEPSFLALAICMAAPVLLLKVILPGKFKSRLIAAIGLCIIAIALVPVFSRTGLVMFALEMMLVIAWVFRQANRAHVIAVALALCLLCGGVFLLLPRGQKQAIYDRFIVSLIQHKDLSAQGRLLVFRGGIELVREHPWGSGPGTSMWRWQTHFEPPQARMQHPQQATSMMSLWPEIAIEQGIEGLVLFLIFLMAFGWKLSRSSHWMGKGLLIAFVVIAGFDFFFLPTVTRADLWSLLALGGIWAESR